jgi:integrase
MSNVTTLEFTKSSLSQNNTELVENLAYQKANATVMAAQFENVSKVTSSIGLPMLVCESGSLHAHANDFIVTRLHHSNFFNQTTTQELGRRSFRPISKQTAHNEADHLRNWLNICANNGVNYLEVSINFLEALIDNLRDDDDDDSALAEGSLEAYINTWRLFYTYLNLMGVEHKLNFPPKIRQQRQKSYAEDQSDFLNYTKTKSQRNISEVFVDPLIDNRRKSKIRAYDSQVLTNDQVSALISELNKIDRVYAVMANVQLDTLLRINELVEYFPCESGNKLNKKWMNAAEMRMAKQVEQPFRFIGKGQVSRELNVDIQTMQMLSDKYIAVKRDGSDITLYDERLIMFNKTYLATKWAEKTGVTNKSTFVWLTARGRPVSKSMYRAAFANSLKVLRKAGEGGQAPVIGSNLYIRPHSLRHTGATHRLLKYSELTGVEISVANIDDINIFLQGLLGHSSFETTERYISTVRKIEVGGIARKTIASQLDVWKDAINSDPILKRGVDAVMEN